MTMFRNAMGGLLAASFLAASATPADAQRYYRHRDHGDDAAIAIGAGILGLGVGAAIASSNRGYGRNQGYYDRGYYDQGYYDQGYYDQGYYGNRGYYDDGYRRCTTRRQWDSYQERWVRVRYC